MVIAKLLKQRDELRIRYERMCTNLGPADIKVIGAESATLTKVINLLRMDIYEIDIDAAKLNK